jgi:hypothetical protein
MTKDEVRIHNEKAESLRRHDPDVVSAVKISNKVKFISMLLIMIPVGLTVNYVTKGPDAQPTVHDVVTDFYFVYGQCLELAKKNVRYPSSFKIDDPRILESKREFEKGRGIDVAFTSQNSYGTRIAGAGHCSVNGTTLNLDSMRMEGE